MSNSLLAIFTILSLTFLLSIISGFLNLLERVKKGVEGISHNSYLFWFFGILAAGILGGKHFRLSQPMASVEMGMTEVVIIIGAIGIFAMHSEYTIHKSVKPFIVFTLIFPIGEEILFRGIIQSLILDHFHWGIENLVIPGFGNVPLAVVISAACFGITHLQYNDFCINKKTIKQVLFASIFGIFAGKMVIRTESIFFPMLLHSFANLSVEFYGLRRRKKQSVLVVDELQD